MLVDDNWFKEINAMKVDIPSEPHEIYRVTQDLQVFLNRLAEMQVYALSLLSSCDNKKDSSSLRCFLKAADIVSGNLKMAKQQIAMLVNNSEILSKAPRQRSIAESDIPGQELDEVPELDFTGGD